MEPAQFLVVDSPVHILFPACVGSEMKTQRLLIMSLLVCFLALCFSVYAQVSRPYRNGTVWTLAFIRMKPGMENAYKNYVANEWKREQEALKAEGISLSYKVLQSEAHSPRIGICCS
jgi:hypothetical protein